MEKKRRSIVKFLVGLPAFALATDWMSSMARHVDADVVDPTQDPTYEARFQAVSALRLLNTAQRAHLMAFGVYASVAELSRSPAVAEWLVSDRAKEAGFDDIYARVRFDRTELIPGWTCTLRLSAQRDRYTLWLRPAGSDELPTFATDEKGVIEQGEYVAKDFATGPAWYAAKDVVQGQSIQQLPRPSHPVARIVKALALGLTVPVFAGLPTGGGGGYCCLGTRCCYQPPYCECFYHCSPDAVGTCTNCGCPCCVWCCTCC